jgi:pimeloyl-ACP methyl ester carboxylesterase
MKSMTQNNVEIPTTTNYVQQGEGRPVIMIHGVAASLHDWDGLIPELSQNGYICYALDLLGHGESPKPESRAYQMDWIFDHFVGWVTSLRLTEPAILIGHSLGGHIALEYARRFSAWTRGLVLVNPFYSRLQLPLFLRRSYSNRNLRGRIAGRTPQWMFRAFVDAASRAMEPGAGALHSLPEHIRKQTALDYKRTAPGVYNIPSVLNDQTEYLSSITFPTLVVWGSHDQTLAPASFPKLVNTMPRAVGKSFRAGHVPHQSNTKEFNAEVLEFLRGLK